MSMTLLLAALASSMPAAAAPGAAVFPPIAATEASSKCQRPEVRFTQRPRPVAPQRLIELPPGRLELTLQREFDGCPIPAVLREGIGGPPAPERRPAR